MTEGRSEPSEEAKQAILAWVGDFYRPAGHDQAFELVPKLEVAETILRAAYAVDAVRPAGEPGTPLTMSKEREAEVRELARPGRVIEANLSELSRLAGAAETLLRELDATRALSSGSPAGDTRQPEEFRQK